MNCKKIDTKDISVIVLIGAIIFGLSALSIFGKAEKYSLTERRALAQAPKVTANDLNSGRFMSDFETYTLDQFPFRDGFRTIKALAVTYGFAQKDCNGFYTYDGYISKLDPMNNSMVTNAADKFNKIYYKYLDDTDCPVYLSVIPDKNYFLARPSGRLSMDYKKFVNDLRSKMKFGKYIDIFPLLSKEDFYKTDQHWRQERLISVAKALTDGMNADFSDNFVEKDAGVIFRGTYLGQSALPCAPENIKYLTNDILEQCTVTSYDTGKPMPSAMYDMDKAKGKDAYEMFLGGSDALLVIENPKAYSDRELVIFRDSFGSSITPLLSPNYSKITLVDIRYISSDFIGNFVDFSDQDVLFLYSTMVLNSSLSFK